MKRLTGLFLLSLGALAADKVTIIKGSASDKKISIEATAFLDREAQKQRLGVDAGENVMVIEVKVTPAPDFSPQYLDFDDFLLRSDRDGQRARPLYATQLAGTAVMVISSKGGTAGVPMTEQRRVPYGVGIPGSPGGAPPVIPGSGTPVVGSATADTSEAQASIEERGDKKKLDPIVDALKKNALPEGEIDKPVSGLLYFSFEGKHKPKHLELVYRKAPPRISIRLEDPNKKK